jgi:serine/threonine protein kinase
MLKETLGRDGIDLLKGCLELNPLKRYNVQQALAHPFFNDRPSIQKENVFVSELILRETEFRLKQNITGPLEITSLNTAMRSELQLMGVACLKLADVFNERSREYYRQENAKEYAFITADEYTES